MGTRLCAYWSQQYRCLYPGRAIESEPPGEGAAVPPISLTPQDFVSVEFDDGDSGRIRLKNIRLLLSNYPIAGVCPGHFCLCILSLCLSFISWGMKPQLACACQARKASGHVLPIAFRSRSEWRRWLVVSFQTYFLSRVANSLFSLFTVLLFSLFFPFASCSRFRLRLRSGSGSPSRCRVQR